MNLKRYGIVWKIVIFFLIFSIGCSKNQNSNTGNGSGNNGGGNGAGSSTTDIQYWVTRGDQSLLLAKSKTPILFAGTFNGNSSITVDSTNQFQSIEGFGFTLTDGSATLIKNLNSTDRNSLLKELFGNDSTSISISYLRLSMGASDLSASVYSYDDMPAGQTDSTLQNFNLRTDKSDVVAVLKQILVVNPNIKIISTPWSPPTWMKDNNNSVGGSLLPGYYNSYALYFVKYIQAMAIEGFNINAVIPQIEPLNPAINQGI